MCIVYFHLLPSFLSTFHFIIVFSGTVGYRCLNELTIGVLGMGQMGKCLAKTFSGLWLDWSVVKTCILLSADFGCEVHGLVSTVRPRVDGDHVTKYFTVAELASMVAGVDYLINVLPSTPSTDNLLNRWDDISLKWAQQKVSDCMNNFGNGQTILQMMMIKFFNIY